MSELLEALYMGQQDRVAELLAQDPELNVFEAAAFGRDERLAELLQEDPQRANAFGDDGFQPLGLACFFGHVGAAKLLVAAGADPNTLARNEHVQTSALHAAAARRTRRESSGTSSASSCSTTAPTRTSPSPAASARSTRRDRTGTSASRQLLVERGAER